MSEEKSTTERLGAFSDAVIAVIITIMVLELKAPAEATFSALPPLGPTAGSYGISYLFIAIIWLNHHHLLRFVGHTAPALIWVSFAHLFGVSLVPFATAWIAHTHLAPVPVAGGARRTGIGATWSLTARHQKPPQRQRQITRSSQ